MTITLLDLYNATASQEWAMYDNDAVSDDELEESLVIALNKAIVEIYSSYDFPFRLRTHLILSIPKTNSYEMPSGLIRRNSDGQYAVYYGSVPLKFEKNAEALSPKLGIPEKFYIKNNNIILYPTPIEKGMVTIDYYTLSIGESASGEEIFALKNANDVLTVPAHLEEIMKEAIMSRTMLNSIASEGDENYSAYKKQADKSYRLLVKYSKGVGLDKAVRF